MEKTEEVLLKEQREELLEGIAKDFERCSINVLESDMYTYNDCAIIAKMYRKMASEIRARK
jgi:hypothetical protein